MGGYIIVSTFGANSSGSRSVVQTKRVPPGRSTVVVVKLLAARPRDRAPGEGDDARGSGPPNLYSALTGR
ncbi:hypothetical protein A5724_18810 [Mycobacterium sp. ACS1612]|uniref:hypothetical protein n=1 Tax=Mycobacterium sp. ACS1612 TaxID=1834117 RepID=UPI0007FD0FAB|nr:hypothetical protein [Mycobacterium sp. ACS1612]OBF33614.1 hypothetical protein A5724_18810 [Mycobacterium sp. ACS1612]